MSEERFSKIEDAAKDLSDKVAHLDISFTKTNDTLRDHANWTKELSNDIKDLTASVRDINVQTQRVPYDRLQDIYDHINPIHDMLRKHENRFTDRKDIHFFIVVVLALVPFALGTLGWFSNYILNDMKADISTIMTTGKINTGLIIETSNYIQIHDKSRLEILKKLHTHRKVEKE